MPPKRHLRGLTRPAPANTDPARLFVLDVLIGILDFIGRIKFG